MLYINYLANNCTVRLNTIKEKLINKNAKIDLSGIIRQIRSACYDLAFILQEYEACTQQKKYGEACDNILKTLDKIEDEEDAESILACLNQIIKITIDQDFDLNLSYYKGFAYDFADSSLKDKLFHNFSSHVLAEILNSIKTNREITMFYPNCGSLQNIGNIKYSNKIFLYGNAFLEADQIRAKEHMTKCVRGKLFGSKIQNNAFDVVYVETNVNVYHDMYDIRNEIKEKETLNNCLKYIRPGGILIYLMPYFRLKDTICNTFARNFNNISIYKSEDRTFRETGLIYIVGQKKIEKDKNVTDEERIKLRRLFRKSFFNNLPKLTYSLPKDSISIELFKGSVLDLNLVDEILIQEDLLGKIIEDQKVDKIEDVERNPLLPFNMGQIGLVLSSGCLDGIIDEDNEHCHLVKGRVVKKTIVNTKVEGKKITDETTLVNKIEINIILPNGEIKTLA